MSNTVISVKNLEKNFLMPDGEIQVLSQVSFEVKEEECLCLLGYSGCGKTTLLRIIAKLENFQTGEISIFGQVHHIPTKEVLLLFQDFNQLFPWKTVLGNILYPMKITNPKGDREELLLEAKNIIQSVGLSGFENSYPHQLSGGMKQRVAVARALAVKPRVLLMDEPFAALDTVNRRNLQILTQKLCKQHHITMIFVTHDVEEAVLMGDRIAIMKSSPGRLGTIIENPYSLSKSSEDKLKTITFIHEYLEKSVIKKMGSD